MSGELMQVAAGGAAEWIRRIAAGRTVTVLCGPGNNGGDGLAISRLLKEQGYEIKVFIVGKPEIEFILRFIIYN